MDYVMTVWNWILAAGALWQITVGLAVLTWVATWVGDKTFQDLVAKLCLGGLLGLGWLWFLGNQVATSFANWGPQWYWALAAWALVPVFMWGKFNLKGVFSGGGGGAKAADKGHH